MSSGIDLRVKKDEDTKRAQEKRMHVYRLTEQYAGMIAISDNTIAFDGILCIAVGLAETVVNWIYADAKRVIDS